MTWRRVLIGCGGLLALGVVLFVVLIIGVAIGGGGDVEQANKADKADKKTTPKKSGPQNVAAT